MINLSIPCGDLPAVVFLASWPSHNTLKDCAFNSWKIDPFGVFSVLIHGPKAQFRSEKLVKKWFLSDDAAMSPAALRDKLGLESQVILMQHRPPHWMPPVSVKTPLLWLAPQEDAIINVEDAHRSAEFYGADFIVVERSNHDVMLEANWRQSAATVERWLQANVTD